MTCRLSQLRQGVGSHPFCGATDREHQAAVASRGQPTGFLNQHYFLHQRIVEARAGRHMKYGLRRPKIRQSNTLIPAGARCITGTRSNNSGDSWVRRSPDETKTGGHGERQ
ncbi:hypothetical protein BGZ61DRAFT_457520 [Ilyonectria robusta]|uniref:uncharacterized protein n=1 Tax=Ilyonectria robusta TaxID=1079257 RepID=UPI001E8D6803|nr:uncharacterized protein BGZ61DRAFT_457520 [Ilyonectria robusta]KAH8677058.1 hypothetical protein BGZ61DRAFT_457520 [Ilyonectria robusta]